MNPQKALPVLSVSVERGDSRKLLSLLALASGAVAMPQTSHADIIYYPTGVTVGNFGLHSFVIDTDLPGTADILIRFGQFGTTSSTSSRFVQLRQNAGYVRFRTNALFATRVPAGMLWSEVGGSISQTATAGTATFLNNTPDSFSDSYYAFLFKDSTQGNNIRYGWMNVSLSNDPLLFGDGPHLTINGWAYETTGAQIAMGVVPEPSSAAVLALGALALGSKGLRSWRRNRPAAGKP